ncbi:MAG: SWIM zinc finger family protein [Bacillota bacterium]
MGRYPKYVPVAEKKKRNKKKIKKLKEIMDISPIKIERRKIASSWWGKAWIDNLEIYADYSNRLARGRKYLRYGAVANLDIEKGDIEGIVIGSSNRYYEIDISIDTLGKEKKKNLVGEIKKTISSLEELVEGEFPKDLKGLLKSKKMNLFPKVDEINFLCSCPDYAKMCKHIVAVLYGVGVKLDQDPLLLFKLRGIDIESLIDETIENKSKELLDKSSESSDRVIENSEMNDLFDVDF